MCSFFSAESEMDSIEQTLISSEMNAKAQRDSQRGAFDANHVRMIKFMNKFCILISFYKENFSNENCQF